MMGPDPDEEIEYYDSKGEPIERGHDIDLSNDEDFPPSEA